MPAFYQIDKQRRLVMSTASGVLTRDGVFAPQQQLLSDPDFEPSFSPLADFKHATRIDLSADDVRIFAESTIFSADSRRAFIVGTDFAYGLGRMFEILRESKDEHGIRDFRSLEEALDFLQRRACITYIGNCAAFPQSMVLAQY